MGVALGADEDIIAFQELHENLGHIIMEHISMLYDQMGSLDEVEPPLLGVVPHETDYTRQVALFAVRQGLNSQEVVQVLFSHAVLAQ
jgi:hypothetical protein